MSHGTEQIDFDHYELVPNQDPFRMLIPDHKAQINSRPYFRSNENSKTQNCRIEGVKQRYQSLLKEKDQKLRQLQRQITENGLFLSQQKQKVSKFKSIIDEIKIIIGKQNIQDSELPQFVKNLIKSLEQTKEQLLKPYPQTIPQNIHDPTPIQLQLQKTQLELANLRSRLLQSTSNNINTIFNTGFGQNSSILLQIRELKEQINKLTQHHSNNMNMNMNMASMGHGLALGCPNLGLIGFAKLNQCKHDEKLKGLIKKYQEMIELYHQNQRYMEEMKDRQEEHFAYFSAIKAQINNSIYRVCGQYTNKRLSDLQNKIQQFTMQKKMLKPQPSILSSQQTKITQLKQQNFNLTQQLTLTKSQITQLTTQLLKKSQAFQKTKDELKTLQKVPEKLVEKLRQKDKRINQLQNTIIDHIDSKTKIKIKDDSINSQESDVQKQKINIRNLKTLVNYLKDQNKHIMQRVQNLEVENRDMKKKIAKGINVGEGLDGVEVVSKDEASIKVVEDIVQILVIAANQQQGCKCKCLQLTTDCLMNLNDQYPELQSILQGLGVVQKTSNLLPVNL